MTKLALSDYFLCFFGRHQYFPIQDLGNHAFKIGCSCCKQEWAFHTQLKLFIKWTPEVQAFYEDLLQIPIIKTQWP